MSTTKKTLSIVVLFSLPFFTAPFAMGNGGLRTVAITGNAAPGTETGTTFSGLEFISVPPVLDSNGQAAFVGLLETGSFSNDTGIWSEGNGNGLQLVARDGSTAPGTNVPFSDFRGSRIIMNKNGQTAFSTILNTSSNQRGFWSEKSDGGLTLVAREGHPAPGTSDVFDSLHDSFSDAHFAFNNKDQIAFEGSVVETGTNNLKHRGLWSEGGDNSLALVALSENAAPGGAPGENFNGFDRIALNSSGSVAFRANLIGAGIDTANDDGIWSERNGGLALIAREGNAAPGAGPNVNFGSFDSNGALTLNSHGETAFRGELSLATSGVDNSNNDAIWSEGGGNGLAMIAREGEHAPGTPAGTIFNFNNFTQNITLNDNGHLAFFGYTEGTEFSMGLWSEGGGNGLELVAQTGKPAPGTEAGVVFQNFFDRTMVLNNRGQIAFYAHLSGPGVVDFNTDGGIWAEDLDGNLQLIAREGGQVDVSDDPQFQDLRTISLLVPFSGNTGNGDGRPSAFNDQGQLVFSAQFTDGSEGVFVSNLVAVPEPSTTALLISLALTQSLVQRRILYASGVFRA